MRSVSKIVLISLLLGLAAPVLADEAGHETIDANYVGAGISWRY